MLLSVGAGFAVTVTGTVNNTTTGKPSAGDKVDLLELSQGMNVLSSTKSDAKGSFTFDIDNPNVPHMVRVTHEGVSYFPAGGPLRPGMTSVSIDVCDSAKKVDGVATNVNVVRLQADQGTLQAVQLIAIKNSSNPPRTLAGDKTHEFYLPENAQLDQVMVQPPGGMAITIPATPEGKSGKYSLNYAIKPGETRFEVAYHLPYSGQASFTPKMTGDVQHFVVMMPKSMKFEAAGGAKFSPMDDQTASVQVATNVNASSNLAFNVSGTGTLADEQQQADNSQAQSGGAGAMAPDNRPGGGLGAPIDAPDPLHSYRWPILGGLAIILLCGATFVVSRSNQQQEATAPVATAPVSVEPPVVPKSQPAAVIPAASLNDRSAMLLEGLKEELFQLELEKQQGHISDEEYQTAKAALDQTLKRALARKVQS